VAALNTGRLPVRLAPLVGRQRELHEVMDTLSRSRLVTLTGPGGTGKTRLALAATDAARAHFAGGVCARAAERERAPELMDAWAHLGETARAVQHYTELVELLAQQVGVPPSAETTALYQRLAGRS